MDLLNQIRADLDKGFSKSDLERLIGLPKNTLTEILKGNRKLSKKGIIKVENFMTSQKPDPFNLSVPKKEVKIQDLNKPTNKVEPKPPLGQQKSNYTINTTQRKMGTDIEPAEGTNRFFLKYGAFTHEEAKKLKDNQ